MDKREKEPTKNCVSERDGQRFAEEIKVAKYMECSALTGEVRVKLLSSCVLFGCSNNTINVSIKHMY